MPRQPIHTAAYNGDLARVRAELQAGANVEADDGHGWTPLILASYYGHLEVVKYLVKEAGANVEVKDNSGKTALDWARECYQTTVVQYLEQGPRRQQQAGLKGMGMINTLEQEQNTWIGAKEAKKSTNCSTRVELDHAISTLEQQITGLADTTTTTELEQRLEYEKELTKLESFKDKMPTVEHLNEWVAKLRKEILANKDNTENAIALSKQKDKLQPRIKLEDEAATKLGINTSEGERTYVPPPPPSAPMEDVSGNPRPSHGHNKPPPPEIPIARAVPFTAPAPPPPAAPAGGGGCCVVL